MNPGMKLTRACMLEQSMNSAEHMSQVWVSTGLGISHQLHRGSSKEGVMLSAAKGGKHHCVQIR